MSNNIKEELSQISEIYYYSLDDKDRISKGDMTANPELIINNSIYQDNKNNYILNIGDHINYRYEIITLIGKGSFGQGVKCYDHKNKEYVCIKILRNTKKLTDQSQTEIKILNHIKQNNKKNPVNIVFLKDHFVFRNFVFIVFDLLDINLYELLKSNNFVGLENKLLKNICFQVLNSLNFLSKHKIIHCDLKPENILLRNLNDKDAFLIDFGGSCFENEIVYSYIQSRYYRSPEVILGKSYNNMIDMWSFGCLLAELKAGRPIFAGDSEHDQLNNIMEYLGVPPQSVLINAKKRKLFFDNKDKPLKSTNKKRKNQNT